MGLIRFGFRSTKYIIAFAIGYYMGGGCEERNIENRIKESLTGSAPPIHETIDDRALASHYSLEGLEKDIEKIAYKK